MTDTPATSTTTAPHPADDPTAADLAEFVALLEQVRPADRAKVLAGLAAIVERRRLH